MKPKLLLVDDDEDIRSQMRWALTQDYEVFTAEDRPSALQAFNQQRPPLVLLDLGLPPHPGSTEEGLATLTELLAADSATKVIIISGQAEKDNAIQAIGAGAYDFLCKPVEIEELKVLLKRGFYVADLERENRRLQRRLSNETFEGMLGTSPQMQTVFNTVRKVANASAPVLILGESGTGKEVASQAIHRLSQVKDGPFVAINCGAIPENLLESELFGHEKGAFTGAHVARPGRIEVASGGTLFLDEVGELPLSLQVKLLRFLQEQRIERVGGRKEIVVDARVIAATNIDLKKAVESGKFREDLYYRLAVVVMKLPPLREREGDVALLAQAFLQRFAAQSAKEGLKYSQEAVRSIKQYSWPGNVRELENRVKRAVIMAEANRITSSDLELKGIESENPLMSLKKAREELERELIQQALRKCDGNVTRAAAVLDVSRPTMYELMEKLGIKLE